MNQALNQSKISSSLSFISKAETSKFPINLANFGKWLRHRLFGISPQEATFARRGFHVDTLAKQQYLEKIGRTFLDGYNAAIEEDNLENLIPRLNATESELRGFAFEGAAMGLTLLDYLTPWKRNRVQCFLEGAGADHVYMVYVGIGWLLARLRQPLEKSVGAQGLRPESLLNWLIVDGYGFHQGYFYWRQYVNGIAIPRELSGYACRAFDQGLGRSLWFVKGADVSQIPETIQRFQPSRQEDLWGGIGLACTYAGGVEASEIEALRKAARAYLPQLAQGAAFGAKARQRAGNLTEHMEIACQILCGMTAEAAAEITDEMLKELPANRVTVNIKNLATEDSPCLSFPVSPCQSKIPNLDKNDMTPAYEIWRKRIQDYFLAVEVRR